MGDASPSVVVAACLQPVNLAAVALRVPAGSDCRDEAGCSLLAPPAQGDGGDITRGRAAPGQAIGRRRRTHQGGSQGAPAPTSAERLSFEISQRQRSKSVGRHHRGLHLLGATEGGSAVIKAGFILVHGGAQCTMPSTPSPDRVRLTITVSPEVHAAFTRLSDASNMSLGRAMGEWLEDTMDAALHAATLLEKARAAPKQVMAQVHAYALGLADETGALLEEVRERARADRSAGLAAAAGSPSPPPVRRGGKSSGKAKAPRGGKAHG